MSCSKLWTDRGFIHMNLVVALGIANLVFLFQRVPDVGTVSVGLLQQQEGGTERGRKSRYER